jgi:hypothetical protein
MKTTTGLFAIGAMVAMTACGGGGDDAGNVTTNTAQATTAVSSVGSVNAAIGSGDGVAAAGAVFAMGGAASTILSPSAEGAARRVTAPKASPEGCECVDGSCTFTDCGDEAGTYTINGSLAVDGDTLTVDLDLAMLYGGANWDWTYDGELTVTDTSVDGSLEGEGGGTFTNPQDNSEITFDWSWSVDYNGIELDAAACAVGGSLDAHVEYSAGTSQGGGSYSGSGHVDFGPTCGAAS